MLLFPLTFLLVSTVQRGIHGWSIRSRYLGSKLGEMQRKAGSYSMLARDLGTSGGIAHLRRTMEDPSNQTDPAHSKTVQDGRQTSFRKFSASNSQAQGFLSNGLRPTALASVPNPTDNPPMKNAKKFWNHFLFRRRSDFQSILPIRNNEVHQEKCRAIPFLQNVAHENCETLVLKNHLCFGRCSTVHVPARGSGEDGGRYTLCSYCSPVKFSRKSVQLKCAGDTQVTKVVMTVEDCQCELQRGRHAHHHHSGPVLIDPSLFGNQA